MRGGYMTERGYFFHRDKRETFCERVHDCFTLNIKAMVEEAVEHLEMTPQEALNDITIAAGKAFREQKRAIREDRLRNRVLEEAAG